MLKQLIFLNQNKLFSFGNRFHKSLICAFYVLVAILTIVLIASIVITDRQSFYKKIDPLACTEITGEHEFDYSSQARLATASPNPQCSSWEPVSLPYFQVMPEYAELPEEMPLSRLWLNFKYKVPENLENNVGLALYSTRMVGGIFSVYVNDHLFLTNEEDWYMQWNYPFYMEIPLSSIHPGQELDIKVALPYRNVAGFSVGSFYIGDVRMLKKWQGWRTFFSINLPTILSCLFVTLGIISLVLSYCGIDPVNNRLFFIVAIIYTISNMQFIYNLPDDRSIEYWYLSITDSSISWFFTASTIYAARYAKTNLKWIVNVVILWALTITIITLPLWNWQVIGFLLQHYITMFLYVLLMAILIYVSLKEKNSILAGITLCIAIYMAGGFYDLTHVSNQTYPDGYYVFTYATTPLMFFFLANLLRNYITSHREVLIHAKTLQQKLDQQKEELLEQSRQLREQETMLAVKDERIRVMRNLHDGVISDLNLLSLDSPQSNEEIKSVLKECAENIQCMVLSLQIEDATLNAALGSFRNKLESRLCNAEIELEWCIGDLSKLTWIGTSEALHLLLFIKEAVNNAMVHARCSVIRLSSWEGDPNDSCIEIVISDNGKGYLEKLVKEGNGRRNMRYRADILGGQILEQSSDAGTMIVLRLPLNP